MAMPPIVDGLTEVAHPPAEMLGHLAGMMGRQPGGSARSDLMEGMDALRRAMAADPKIADRIRRALAILQGRESDVDEDEVPDRVAKKPPRVSDMVSQGGSMMSPV